MGCLYPENPWLKISLSVVLGKNPLPDVNEPLIYCISKVPYDCLRFGGYGEGRSISFFKNASLLHIHLALMWLQFLLAVLQ